MSAGITMEDLLKFYLSHKATQENIENHNNNSPAKAACLADSNMEGTRARAGVQECRSPATPTTVARPLPIAEAVAERKYELSQIPSLRSLRKTNVVEMVDIIVSPLASMDSCEGFFSEVANQRDIAIASKNMWELISAAITSARIDMSKAIPTHRLALAAPFDTNVRTHPGFYKLRVAAAYKNLVSAKLTSHCVVAGWPEQPDTDVWYLDRKWHASKIMEQIFLQFGVNSTPTTVGAPRGTRGYRVCLSTTLRAQTEGTLDLGELGKFTAVPVSDKVHMDVLYVYGPTGEASAKLDLGKALAQYLGISSDLLVINRVRETPRGVIILAIEYPFSQEAYDAVAELFDIGHFSVENARKPHLKPIEVFVANSVLELQSMTGVKCVSVIQDKSQSAEAEEIVEVNMSPLMYKGRGAEVEAQGPTVEVENSVICEDTPAEPLDIFVWIPWDSRTIPAPSLDGSVLPPLPRSVTLRSRSARGSSV